MGISLLCLETATERVHHATRPLRAPRKTELDVVQLGTRALTRTFRTQGNLLLLAIDVEL